MSNWMTCTTCRAIVQLNATGICLGCQGGFSGPLEEENYKAIKEEVEPKKETGYLPTETKLKEEEDAVQKSSSEEVYVQSKTKTSKRVRKGNPKKKKITKES